MGDSMGGELLSSSLAGDALAQGKLLELMYDYLQPRASKLMRSENVGHSLQTVDLLHEAYLRLIGQDLSRVKNREHFLQLGAMTMRRVLIDRARKKRAAKRGGDPKPVSLLDDQVWSWKDPAEMLVLDEALDRLAQIQPRQAKVVELRFFGGLSLEETAQALGVSRDTIKLDWRFARAWLNRELGGEARQT